MCLPIEAVFVDELGFAEKEKLPIIKPRESETYPSQRVLHALQPKLGMQGFLFWEVQKWGASWVKPKNSADVPSVICSTTLHLAGCE